MTAQKDRIARALHEIGAAWATTADKYCSPDDPLEDQASGRATYHVHPDRSEPHVRHIQRFDSLRELEAWIREQKTCHRAHERGKRMSVSLPQEWKEKLRRRYGSVQAGVEIAVKKELEKKWT